MFRLLVVDDDPYVLRAIAAVLTVYETRCFLSPRNALAAVARGEHFDAAVLDYRMPELTGFELQDAIAEVDPRLAERVVFATGSPEVFRAARKRGVPVAKPFSTQQLQTVLASVLAAEDLSAPDRGERESVEDPDTEPTWESA